MKTTLKRTLTAGALAIGLTVGSLAVALPAQAATRFESVHIPISVHNHTDYLNLTPASKTEWKYKGESTDLATYYNISLKDGKKVLARSKHVSTWRVLYIEIKALVTSSGDERSYKSDKAIAASYKKAAAASTATAKKYVLHYLNVENGGGTAKQKRESETEALVNSQVTTVQVDITEGAAIPTGRLNDKDGIYAITSTTSNSNFTVKGYDPKDNYTYTYDSKTGEFKVGKIHS